MNKVGIVTYALFYNYGTALQAYALQQAVASLPQTEAELIDYRFNEKLKRSAWWYLKVRIKRFFYYFTATKKIYRKIKYKDIFVQKKPAFDEFFEKYFVLSKNRFLLGDDLMKNPPSYDVYMVGSDQTWSPLVGFYPALFLEFAPTDSCKVAYAPSLGVTILTEEQKRFLQSRLSSFKSISCREAIGARLLSECLGREIPTVLDPTLLLTKERWGEIATKPNIEGDYILCYFIGDRAYYRDYVRKLSEKMHCPAYYIPVSWRDVGEDNNLITTAGPREFLGLIKNARCVCTDSFHGSIFSLNMNTNFYTFLKIAGGENAQDNSRIVGILNEFGLKNRLRSPESPVEFEEIDFETVNRHLDELRSSSWEFLKEAVKA